MAVMRWIIAALGLLSAQAAISNDDCAPQNATVFSLEYAYPLVPFISYAFGVSNANGGALTNTFYHNTELFTSKSTDVVCPDVDTLHSSAVVDLSTSDLVVTVPAGMEGRFYVVSCYDLYGNNIANLGTLNNSSPGQYIIQFCAGDDPSQECQSGDDTYQGHITMPTVYGVLVARTLVKNSIDLPNVVAMQKNFSLSTIPHERYAPTLTEDFIVSGIQGTLPEELLQLAARFTPFNRPEVTSDVGWVNSTLECAGMANGVYTQPAGVNLTAATMAALDLASSGIERPGVTLSYPNNWTTFSPDVSGDFKSNYDIRAVSASQSYLQLTADQVVCLSFNGTLLINQAYTVTFFGKPPFNSFWSLTVYGPDLFLVDNSLNRYSLGDRSNMTYSDGSLVYGSQGDSSEVFQMLLQSTEPPSNWTANWIPTPTKTQPQDGGNQFNVNLCFYAPSEGLFNGDYLFPRVVPIQPIVEGN